MERTDDKYDVIIVGAGPAGCSCAHELLKNNKKVLILDKAQFPRHKPCAGGITMKTLKHLPVDINHLVQHKAQDMVFSFSEKRKIKLNHDKGSCVMVIRDKFDEFFFNETVKAGAVFKKINKINKIRLIENKVAIDFDGKTYLCDYLIGADGANSVVRKLTSDFNYKNPVFAYEGLVEKNGTNYPTEFIFNKHGYAWIFPKRNHYNVGIGNLISSSKSKNITKKDLHSFVSDRFGSNKIEDITAFPIGTEGDHYKAQNNIFLVGDAAGLAESLLGEGIYNAVLSGKFAGSSIVDSYNNDNVSAKLIYNKFLLHLTDELKLYRKGAKILYGFPRISYWMMRFGLGKKFMDGYSEGKTLSEIMGKKSIFAN
jgi:geranylgeranyl reductase family protein